MEFRIEKEIRHSPGRPARDHEIDVYCGPCLICDSDTKYGDLPMVHRFGYRWIENQFAPKRRRNNQKSLRTAGHVGGSASINTIQSLLCEGCRLECREAREKDSRIREAERLAREDRLKVLRQKEEHHLNWRTANPGEFDLIKEQTAEFRVVTAGFRLHEIQFKFKPSYAGQCRGDCPCHEVEMWIDGKLGPQYLGWELRPFDAGDDSDPFADYDAEQDNIQDMFGLGFCGWIESEFQTQLVAIESDEELWVKSSGNEDLPDLDKQGPWILRIHLPDDDIYAKIIPSRNTVAVAEFARKLLNLKIERRGSIFVDVLAEFDAHGWPEG